jgi:hypothetical protein
MLFTLGWGNIVYILGIKTKSRKLGNGLSYWVTHYFDLLKIRLFFFFRKNWNDTTTNQKLRYGLIICKYVNVVKTWSNLYIMQFLWFDGRIHLFMEMCRPRDGEANLLFSVCRALWRPTATASRKKSSDGRGISD